MTTVKKKVERSKVPLLERGKPTSFWDSLFVAEDEKNMTKNFRYGALFISLLPTGVMDVIFALAMHGIAYYNDGKGPSVLYNTCAGMHAARGRYLWAAPALAADYADRKMSSETQKAHGAAFAAGFAYGLWNKKVPKGAL